MRGSRKLEADPKALEGIPMTPSSIFCSSACVIGSRCGCCRSFARSGYHRNCCASRWPGADLHGFGIGVVRRPRQGVFPRARPGQALLPDGRSGRHFHAARRAASLLLAITRRAATMPMPMSSISNSCCTATGPRPLGGAGAARPVHRRGRPARFLRRAHGLRSALADRRRHRLARHRLGASRNCRLRPA